MFKTILYLKIKISVYAKMDIVFRPKGPWNLNRFRILEILVLYKYGCS